MRTHLLCGIRVALTRDRYFEKQLADEREEAKTDPPIVYNVHAADRAKQWAAKREELLAKYDDLLAQLALLKANQRFLIGKLYDPRVAELLQQEEDSDDDEDTFTPAHFLPYGIVPSLFSVTLWWVPLTNGVQVLGRVRMAAGRGGGRGGDVWHRLGARCRRGQAAQ